MLQIMHLVTLCVGIGGTLPSPPDRKLYEGRGGGFLHITCVCIPILPCTEKALSKYQMNAMVACTSVSSLEKVLV